MELKLEELEAAASEDELAARAAATETVATVERKRPSRRFPDHLPRERVVVAALQTCPCCGSTRLSKLGEEGGAASTSAGDKQRRRTS
jgi:transposase